MSSDDWSANRPLRSVLFMPAWNSRAMDKARSLACDAVVLDLEDATAPERKAEAREAAAVRGGGFGERLLAVRVNGLDTDWGADDLAALSQVAPEVVVAPKVGSAADVRAYAERLHPRSRLWAMVETCRGVLNLAEIARVGGPLSALVLGVNDLSKDMRRPLSRDRSALHAAMSLTVTAARAHGLTAVDGVFNDLEDAEALAAEAAEGRAFGFDGKSLIHPSQIEAANRAFSPSRAELNRAHAVIAAFAAPENVDKGAVRVDGAMAERLHLAEAERVVRLGSQGVAG